MPLFFDLCLLFLYIKEREVNVVDKDIKKIISFILLLVVFIGIPTGYFLIKYRQKILEIEVANKITLPEEETPGKEEEPTKDKEDGIDVIGENIVGSIEDEEPTEEPDAEEDNPEETPNEDDKKEGLIVDNSYPNFRDKDNPTVNFGPTTGKMGSKINPNDVSGFKKELSREVNNMIGEIKQDPNRVNEENKMTYFAKTVDSKIVEDVMIHRLQEYQMGKTERLLPPTSFVVKDMTYLVTTMDLYEIETVYDNPEGILNEIKLQAPGFLRAAYLPDYGGFSYDYGYVSVYFNTETNKNEVAMIFYNFVKLTPEKES